MTDSLQLTGSVSCSLFPVSKSGILSKKGRDDGDLESRRFFFLSLSLNSLFSILSSQFSLLSIRKGRTQRMTTTTLPISCQHDDERARRRIARAIEAPSSPTRRAQHRLRRSTKRRNINGISSPFSSSGSSSCASPPPRPLLTSAFETLAGMGGGTGALGGPCGANGSHGGRSDSSAVAATIGTAKNLSSTQSTQATTWELSLFDDLALWDAKCRKEKAKKAAARERDASARVAALALLKGGRRVTADGSVAKAASKSLSSASSQSSTTCAVAAAPASAFAAAASTFYSPDSVLLAADPWSSGKSRLVLQQQQQQQQQQGGSAFFSSCGEGEEDEGEGQEEEGAFDLDGSDGGAGGGYGTPRSLLLLPKNSSSSNGIGGSLATPPHGLAARGASAADDDEFDGGAFDDGEGDYSDVTEPGNENNGRRSGEEGTTLEELADGFAAALDWAWWSGFCLSTA